MQSDCHAAQWETSDSFASIFRLNEITLVHYDELRVRLRTAVTPQACRSSPGWYLSTENLVMIMMMPAGDNSWLVHQSSQVVLPAETSEKVGGIDEWVRILSISIRNTSRVLLHAVKSYDMGPSRFTSHPKEGVLPIFIALKNPSPQMGLNPQPLGIVANTLTITPPRRLNHSD
jgi:hypothetical protein